ETSGVVAEQLDVRIARARAWCLCGSSQFQFKLKIRLSPRCLGRITVRISVWVLEIKRGDNQLCRGIPADLQDSWIQVFHVPLRSWIRRSVEHSSSRHRSFTRQLLVEEQ